MYACFYVMFATTAQYIVSKTVYKISIECICAYCTKLETIAGKCKASMTHVMTMNINSIVHMNTQF